MSNKTLRIFQINAARDATVNAELLAYCHDNNIDILLKQEPYTRNNILVGLECSPYRVIILRGGAITTGRQSITTWSAIMVINLRLDVLEVATFTSPHIVVATVGYPQSAQYVLISTYFQFRTPTIVFTNELQNLACLESHTPIILGADVNAFSEAWGGRST